MGSCHGEDILLSESLGFGFRLDCGDNSGLTLSRPSPRLLISMNLKPVTMAFPQSTPLKSNNAETFEHLRQQPVRLAPVFLRSLMGIAAIFCSIVVAGKLWSQELEQVQTTVVDTDALTFAFGPAARFSNTANGRTHQQTALTTYRGYQYVTYYNAKRQVCVGRRKLPSGSWNVIAFQDHRFETNDSHNAAVLGICDKDGTIHMAFDHHATQLNYRVSKLGAAHRPESVQWNADLFGPVTHTLGSVTPDSRVTYPRFFASPNGNLMLFYRGVTSGDGNGMIEEYDGDRHDWTVGLGKVIARDIGTYVVDGESSLYRCPYMNSLSYAGKRLHASWVWRDRFEKTHPDNQHDLCYAYSDDDGRTWHNSNGDLVGRTGQEFIHLDTPGIVVADIPTKFALTNQNTHFAYADDSIHIVLTHRSEIDTGRTWVRCYHHYWRNRDGVWRHQALPFSGKRPKLVGTEDRQLVLAYTDDGELFFAIGQPNDDRSAWEWKSLKMLQQQSIFGDIVLDSNRWQQDQVLSIYAQQVPSTFIETDLNEPLDGIPTPLRVIDYRIVSPDADQH